jgi:thiol-disulfide isomerase/thioredoxin
MISLASAPLLTLLATASTGGGGGSGSITPRGAESVQELTTVKFDTMVGNGSTWYVMLYAPWCSHCRRGKQVLAAVADSYKSNTSVSVGQADATRQIALAIRFGVTAFPKFIMVCGASTYRVHPRTSPSEEDMRTFIDSAGEEDTITNYGSLDR